MITQGQRWLVISRTFAMTQYISISQFPLTWNPTSKEYGVIKDLKKVSGWIFCHIIGLLIGGLIPFYQLCNVILVGAGDFPWIRVCFCVQLLLIQICGTAISYAVFNYSEGFIPFGSQIAYLEKSLQQQESKLHLTQTLFVLKNTKSRLSQDKDKAVEFAMSILTLMITYFPFPFVAVMVYGRLDPLYLVIPIWISESLSGLVIRFLAGCIFMCELARTMGLLFLVSLVALISLIYPMELLHNWEPKTLIRRRMVKKYKDLPNNHPAITNPFYLLTDLQHYTCLKIFVAHVKPFVAIAVAFSVLCGTIICISMNYIVFKMYNQLSLNQYLGFVMMDITLGIACLLGIPYATKLHSSSSELLRSWGKGGKPMSKYRNRILKTFRPIAVPVGSFLEVNKSAKILWIQLIFEYTVTALVTI